MKDKKTRAVRRARNSDKREPMVSAAGTRTVLDFGCGLRKRPGAIGIDVNPRSSADVIHDLNQFPYPFPDNSFDEIFCDNVIEHLDNVVMVMEELHRIAKPSAEVIVIVPFYPHRQAHTDPTHKHYFGIHSFDYFIEGTAYAGFQYSKTKYDMLSVEFDRGINHPHWFDRLLAAYANRRKEMYENRLSNIFPLRNLTFHLRVVK
jgi:SAM-dependent methyltransferase